MLFKLQTDTATKQEIFEKKKYVDAKKLMQDLESLNVASVRAVRAC